MDIISHVNQHTSSRLGLVQTNKKNYNKFVKSYTSLKRCSLVKDVDYHLLNGLVCVFGQCVNNNFPNMTLQVKDLFKELNVDYNVVELDLMGKIDKFCLLCTIY